MHPLNYVCIFDIILSEVIHDLAETFVSRIGNELAPCTFNFYVSDCADCCCSSKSKPCTVKLQSFRNSATTSLPSNRLETVLSNCYRL